MEPTDLIPLLEGQNLCLECLAARLACRREEIARLLDELGTTRSIAQRQALCAGCVGVRITYRIA